MNTNTNSNSSFSCGSFSAIGDGDGTVSSKFEAADSIVNLNVGGRHFSTSLTTLTSDPNSVLAKMFSKPNPARLDQDGRFFIDRNGDVFEVILEYLRSRQLLDSGVSKRRVRAEAEFFGLDGLLKDLQGKMWLTEKEQEFIEGDPKKVIKVYFKESPLYFQAEMVKEGGRCDASGTWFSSYGEKVSGSHIYYENLDATTVFFDQGFDDCQSAGEFEKALEKRLELAKMFVDLPTMKRYDDE